MHINLEYLGSFNDVNYSKRLRYEVYDSNYKLTGSGQLFTYEELDQVYSSP